MVCTIWLISNRTSPQICKIWIWTKQTYVGKPSCLQATNASLSSNRSSHTVPQLLFVYTSILPAVALPSAIRMGSTEAQECILYSSLHLSKHHNISDIKCKIQKNWCTVTVAPTIEYHGGHSRTPANQMWGQVSGGVSVSWLASRTRHGCPRHNESVYIYIYINIWRLESIKQNTLLLLIYRASFSLWHSTWW